jgi:Mrp family chromosome partitioning ATPase
VRKSQRLAKDGKSSAYPDVLPLQAEQLQTIAAQLLHRRRVENCRGVTICAVSRGEGATFLAVSLATAIAQSGLSTALVDLDLEEPGVSGLIPAEADVPGVAQLLTQPDLELADVLQPAAQRGLTVIQAGANANASHDLIGLPRCQRFLQDCARMFEFTVVDTPPANRSADMLRAIDAVGYAVIVARRDRTYMDDVATLARQIRESGAVLLGSILVEA